MSKQSRNDEAVTTINEKVGFLSGHVVAAVIAGIAAAWIAADSTGFWGLALRHALTYIVLGVALVAAWPWPDRTGKNWAILVAGAGAALALSASSLAVVNILGAALLLATLAYVHGGLNGRALLLGSLAATVLAVFRLACQTSGTVWQLANVLGWSMGKAVGWLTGRPLNIGVTFGGIDFLVLMIALYIGWLQSTAGPKRNKAIYAGAAIILAQLAYLVVLAYSENIIALLPEPVYAQETDVSRVGLWAWQNAVRGFLPWNLPVMALILQAMVAWCMFRWVGWLPLALSEKSQTALKSRQPEVVDLRSFSSDVLLNLGLPVLAVLIAALTSLSFCKSDLKGKTIVAYEKGNFSWLRPEYDNSLIGGYGMLPVFVESLGGRFVKSANLAEQDLAKADVLILLHPDSPLTDEQSRRIENFVRQGGSLLLGAENYIRQGASESHFNDALKSTNLEVRYDTVMPLSDNWEQCYQALFQPATLGMDDLRNRYGFQRGASIRLGRLGRPVLIGRWGWSTPGSDALTQKSTRYEAGQALGDIVLMAEEGFGKGRIAVLGDMSCISNERLSCSWEFVGRLLSYLANRSSNPQDLWRQTLAIAAIVLFIGLLAKYVDAPRLAIANGLMALALISCTYISDYNSQVLPDGGAKAPNNLAYIDDSHLEAFSSDLWNDYGIAGFTRVLMRNGFLALRLRELSSERLERAKLLVCMAPARQFSAEQRASVRRFVEQGGTLICLVGAEEARPIASLLEDFQFKVSPSPVKPGEDIHEPDPLGALLISYGRANEPKIEVQFYAAWPITSIPQTYTIYVSDKLDGEDLPVVARTEVGQGIVLVIADTFFASNQNLETLTNTFPSHMNFWRMLLSNNTSMGARNASYEPIQEQGPAEVIDKP
jgi:hypothetical protein